MELWLLNNLSTLSTAAVLVGGFVILALAGSAVAHRRFPSLAEGEHNDMVGVVLGMFGAIYGIILAFVVVTLWTQMQTADSVVATEASDLAQIVRNVRALPPSQNEQVKTAVGEYAHTVVEVQWPLMREGRADYAASQNQIDKMYTALQSYEPETEKQKIFYRQVVEQLNDVVSQRRARITQSQQQLPLLLQGLVYGGALVIVPLTFLYGNKSCGARLLFAGSVAALIGFSLLLVLVLDRPFAGDISITPNAFKEGALAQFW
ncbi:DUF4239 domain-containing protein [Streptomyces roseoverticillatus]|uniref:bestrophin-like domain n=1 Tax=Streptomyces roseoverticillatus TaxID=66429 RepID=UPI003405C7A8